MQEIKKSKFSNYYSKWTEWLFFPSKASKNLGEGLSSTEFFVGNLLGALLGVIITTFILFAEFKESKLSEILKTNGSSVPDVFMTLLGAYLATIIISTLITSTLSYIVFKAAGSTISLKKHLSIYMEITYLEPAATIFFSYALIAAISQTAGSALLVLITLAVLWFFTRFWYFGTYWVALKQIHGLSNKKFKKAYIFGHIPAFLIFHILLLSGAWTLVGLLVLSSHR